MKPIKKSFSIEGTNPFSIKDIEEAILMMKVVFSHYLDEIMICAEKQGYNGEYYSDMFFEIAKTNYLQSTLIKMVYE